MRRKKSPKTFNPIKMPREPYHPRRLPWPTKWLKLLGRMPDAKLARKMGASLDAVKAERRRRRIEPYRPRIADIEWTHRMTRLLGTDTDENIAARLGIPWHAARHKRRKMGIPPYTEQPRSQNTFGWTREKIALLGTNSDRVIAKRLGVSAATIVIKRAALGIKSFYPKRRIRWTKKMVALLGKVTDWKIADRYKIDRESVARERQGRGIPRYIDTRPVKRSPKLKSILSQPIRSISRRYNIAWDTIARLRRELGVPTPQRWPAKRRGRAISSG